MMETPEELIEAMSTQELQELLLELGIEATEAQANGIKQLVRQLGTLDEAFEVINGFAGEGRRAA